MPEIRDAEWKHLHRLAAELVVHHARTTDLNLIEKTIHMMVTTRAAFDDVETWLTTQMEYAPYFERSAQTVPQLATAVAVLQDIHYMDTTLSSAAVAERMGWVIRLARYYAGAREEARDKAPRKMLTPNELPAKPVFVPPQRKAEVLSLEEIERRRAFAEDLSKQLAARDELAAGKIFYECKPDQEEGGYLYFDLEGYASYRGYFKLQGGKYKVGRSVDVVVVEIEPTPSDGVTYVFCKPHRQ